MGDDLVAAGVNIISILGGTEFSALTHVKPKHPDRTPEDWAWLEMTERIRKRWVKQEDDESGTYELQILVRLIWIMVLLCIRALIYSALQDSDVFAPAVHNAETEDGPAYATSDLYIQHPTKEGMWKM